MADAALSSPSIPRKRPEERRATVERVNDQFYSDYNEDMLVVRGLVASLTGDGGGVELQFQTQTALTTRLQFDKYPATVHPGDTISVITDGAIAERLTFAVLLRGCHLLGG